LSSFGKYILLLGFVLFGTKLLAFDGDTLRPAKPAKIVKVPKHYFKNTIYYDYYAPGERKLDTTNKVSAALKSYKVSQMALGFNVPVVTKDFYNKDSTKVSNLHFLFTGSFNSVDLQFGGISRHRFNKTSIGFRGIYNNGGKSTFFVEASPFVVEDVGYDYTRTSRIAATALYNYSPNEHFCFRLGFTRSFLWGNMFNLPYIGFRFGRLDKTNFSIQFPRSITLNVPMGSRVRFSLYTKPQGGLYTFANTDSIKVGSIADHQTLYFGRAEFLSGARFDIMPCQYFNFYVSAGFTTRNHIEFYPAKKEKSDPVYGYTKYYGERINPSVYVNFGLVFRFGKSRSVYNNKLIYESMDLNNSIDGGDNNINPGNGDIPAASKKVPVLKTDDMIDLIETQDLY
jgi:hypothetical protein